MRASAIAIVCAVLAAPTLPARAQEAGPPFDHLPDGWSVVQHFVVPADQVTQIGRNLGGNIQRLTNTVLDVGGARIKVNLIDCTDEDDARRIHAKVLGMKGDPAFCLHAGARVIEFVGDNADLARRVARELDLATQPETATYLITAKLVPVAEADYMAASRLANLLTSLEKGPADRETRAQIPDLAAGFEVGDSITLRTCGEPVPTYSFDPAPTGSTPTLGGDATCSTFDDLPKTEGLPTVSLTARVTAHATGLTPTKRKADASLLQPTPYWPVDDDKVQALAKEITTGCDTVEEKTDALLRWLQPGANVRFEGPVQGSRYGVAQVLEQGFGHCWDFADLFVTLARAAGVPARQLGGWLYGTSGHIWAEVLIEGRGWQQVDPTGGGQLRCGLNHIAYFVTEDGGMPILYALMPTVEVGNR